jgi:hypothetical protein
MHLAGPTWGSPEGEAKIRRPMLWSPVALRGASGETDARGVWSHSTSKEHLYAFFP